MEKSQRFDGDGTIVVEGKQSEVSRFDTVGCGSFRNKPDADPVGDEPDYGHRCGRPCPNVKTDLMAERKILQVGGKGGVFGPEDEGHDLEVARGKGLFRKRRFRRGDKDKALDADHVRRDVGFGRGLEIPFRQGKLEVAVSEAVDESRSVRADQTQSDTGKGPRVFGEYPGNRPRIHSWGVPHIESSRFQRPQAFHPFRHFIQPAEDFPGGRVEEPSFRSQSNPPLPAVEKLHAEMFLEAGDVLAD